MGSSAQGESKDADDKKLAKEVAGRAGATRAERRKDEVVEDEGEEEEEEE